MKPNIRLYYGYTIIELIVVMSVLGILATAALPLMELSVKRSKERELKQAVWEIRRAIDAYKESYDTGRITATADASGYPPSLAELVAGVPDAKNKDKTIFFLRRIPLDPFAQAPTSAAMSWGVRSYASSAESPEVGRDVFDVYSKSMQIGINGIPYKQW